MKTFLCIAAGTLLFLSCQDTQQREYIAKIDQLENDLDSMQQVAEEHRVDTIPQLVAHIKQRTFEVTENYSPDTIDYKIATMMNDYKEIRKALSANKDNYEKVKIGIPEVKEKLQDLRFDIESGLGERDRYEEYYLFEKQKVNQIEEILKYYIETLDKYREMYEKTEPKVNVFIEDLKRQAETAADEE